jgi:Fe-S-cluster containining protein
VLLLRHDAERISKYSKLKIESFSTKIEGKEPYIYEANKNPETGKCVFLIENKCRIYKCRPLICRFYPFELSTEENGNIVFSATDECPIICSPESERGKKLGISYFRDLLRLATVEFELSSY